MSENAKYLTRPKVRFCQTDAGKLITKELESSTDQNGVKQSNKPKILSVVKLNKFVKLVDPDKVSNNEENNSKVIDNESNANLTLCANALSSASIETSSLNENIIKTGNQIPLNDASNIQNIKTNTSDKTDLMKEYTKSRKEKENKSTINKKGIKTVTKTSTDLDILKHKVRLASANSDTKKYNATNKKSSSITTKKNLNLKPADVMPCYKYNKVASKIKTPIVKKVMIRNIIGSKIQPNVGPGVLRSQPDNLKILKTDEKIHTKPITSGEKLAKPEYNSIICTINKLKEMKKQKVVTDIEHLPTSYKNLINSKISTVLDFPLDEVIYRDLVDLSIDENQLPSRLTRSKDPEPRQKDVVPILSDFFAPESTEEYCIPVSIKPRTAETMDNWNAFRISDQINEWKHILNHE
ncbi:unnamed protein product [Heterotrigona itama]|uniref:Protein phosphatase 1 regulatory subunit 35 C-terminal domain-containing protein n=1 Tax=Heterotrigona itama TaxID=395501 RepID=A0A6V7H3F2_9HYME|nr:unnamed protein product [Heterotrigona itama]